jgi:lipopolysaccharide/colanic/teichoic acid biosynthesis glycosyltransferase
MSPPANDLLTRPVTSWTDSTLSDSSNEITTRSSHKLPPRRRSRPARLPEFSLAKQRLEEGELFVEPAGHSTAYWVVKRTMDIAGASVALVLFSPIMLTVFLVLLVTTKGRPFFCQERVGYRGRRFHMIKFRTMRLDAHKMQHLVANELSGPVFKNRRDPRITRLGAILRATSIDETPQLLNVLLGQMSLVGPRPLPVGEVAGLKAWQRGRLAVVPGLTCLWQVSGRSEIGFMDWVRMDLWYVENQGLWTDVKLLVKTPYTVISGRGAY